MKFLQSQYRIPIIAIAVLNVLFLAILLNQGIILNVSGKELIEVKELEGNNMSFRELSNYFTELAETKGAPYSLDVLKVASVPPNIDMHLLGHVVGDLLYRQQGLLGIKVCTHDFRNACSHSIVVGVFLEQGIGALDSIASACRQAPGGKGAYTMCFHGLGHGVLAHTEYDMEKAVELCKLTGTPEYGNREYIECVGGTVMEMMAGINDKDAWEKQRPNYFKEEDPLAPCSLSFMPKEARPICYTYLTPNLFTSVGAKLGNPEDKNFKEAFPLCNNIPETQKENRDACYGGFGKEFVVLAKARDIRNIENMTSEELKKVYDWCTLADNKEGVISCILSAERSLYWGGENDSGAAIRFCEGITNSDYQSTCFKDLVESVSYYIGGASYRKDFCDQVPESFREHCINTLL